MTTIPMTLTTTATAATEASEASGFALRAYQHETVNALREGLKAGHQRQILASPTGSGKTVVAGHLIKEALAKGSRCLFVVDRIALVQQTSQRFSEMGIAHGVMQGSNTWGGHERVQLCSAQTLERRQRWPGADLIIIDEAHSQRKATLRFIDALDAPVIGLTATPFTEGLGKVYSHVVNTCTTDQLLEWQDPATGKPYLAPLIVYAATEIDMRGARTKAGGEWLDREVEQRGSVIIGDAVTEWEQKTRQHFGGPVKTLVRSATIAHGEEICRAFQLAGHDFRQSTYLTKEDEGAQMIEDFRAGRFLGLVSVDKFNKGFDVPDILCLIDQRPLRKSIANEIQFLGRGMRAAPGKDHVLVLDHTANFLGWQQQIDDFFAHGVHALDEGKHKGTVRREVKERQGIVCDCGFVLPRGAKACPACGKAVPPRKSGVRTRPGAMRKLERGKVGAWRYDPLWTWRNICGVAMERKQDWAAAQKFALAQYRQLLGDWPPREWRFDPIDAPHPAVRAVVKRQLIAYWHARKA